MLTTIVILMVLFGIILLSPLTMTLDTKLLQADFSWGFLGKARIWYSGEWQLRMNLLFFHKTIRIADMKIKSGRKNRQAQQSIRKKNRNNKKLAAKIFRLIKTFSVLQWKLYVDTGDSVRNAQLYPLNSYSKTYNHVFINFTDENYLQLKIRNYPWKIAYAFLK